MVYQTFSKHSLILYSPGWQALCRSIHDVLFVFALKSTQCQKEKQQSDLTDVSGRVRQTRKYSEIHRSSRNFWTFAKNIRNTRKGTENSSRNFTLQIIRFDRNTLLFSRFGSNSNDSNKSTSQTACPFLPFLVIFTAISIARVNCWRFRGDSLHGRFQIAVKSRLKSQQKSPEKARKTSGQLESLYLLLLAWYLFLKMR